MSYQEFSGELDKPTEFAEFTGQLDSEITDTGDETDRLAARFPAPERTASSLLPKPMDPLGIGRGKPMGAKPESGLIASVGRALKPEFKSVMEGYEPTPQERQAEIDKRLSYGAGPISQKTAAVSNEVRSSRGQMASKDPTVNKVIKAMDARGEKSLADIVDSANRPEIVRAARDAKADEFRSAGEWAADTLSSLSQGAVGHYLQGRSRLNFKAVTWCCRKRTASKPGQFSFLSAVWNETCLWDDGRRPSRK
jgi:hypothetical protein